MHSFLRKRNHRRSATFVYEIALSILQSNVHILSQYTGRYRGRRGVYLEKLTKHLSADDDRNTELKLRITCDLT